MGLLEGAGHTGRLQIQVPESVPADVWPPSLAAIARGVEDFGAPSLAMASPCGM